MRPRLFVKSFRQTFTNIWWYHQLDGARSVQYDKEKVKLN